MINSQEIHRLGKDVAHCVIDGPLHSTDTAKVYLIRDQSIAFDVSQSAHQMEKYGTAVGPIAHLTKNTTRTATTETARRNDTKQIIRNWVEVCVCVYNLV